MKVRCDVGANQIDARHRRPAAGDGQDAADGITAIGLADYTRVKGHPGEIDELIMVRVARTTKSSHLARIGGLLGSMGLLAAFPIAFAIIMPAVYFPILIMLLSLIFRGVAFKFRYRDSEHRSLRDFSSSFSTLGRSNPAPLASWKRARFAPCD